MHLPNHLSDRLLTALSKNTAQHLKGALFIGLFLIASWYLYQYPLRADQAAPVRAEEYGVYSAVASLKTIEEKQQALDKVVEAGFVWTRDEFRYEPSINFENYDIAHRLTKERGLKTLGILSYPGPEASHDQWKQYVSAIVSHYKDVEAWEIMNEADHYLSGTDYLPYLREANEIIRQQSPQAIIVLSGITSRPEAAKFWDELAAAGGWSLFDVLGLHHYHRQNPERVNFGGGDLIAELTRPVSSIRKYGDKKIWVTEIGYVEEVGRTNQANWLARNFLIAKSIPEVDKLFVYRLTNKGTDFPFGLLDTDLSPFPMYEELKRTINELAGKPTGKRIQVADRKEVDAFESTVGWSTFDKKNAEVSLATEKGTNANALKINYTFTADQAYVSAGKRIPLNRPQAIAAWFYGDDSNNVWKFRFKDSKGETFQADLGAIPSGWYFKQFLLDHDTAIVSWDGDSFIDYPIYFDSIVIDHQNGKLSGSGMVDELTVIDANADVFAYQYDSLLAYWKAAGAATTQICGQSVDVKEVVGYQPSSGCQEKPIASLPTAATTATPSPQPAAKTTKQSQPKPKAAPSAATPPPAPQLEIDPGQSLVSIVGRNVAADGVSQYQLKIALRDTAGHPVLDQQPRLQFDSEVKATQPSLLGETWISFAKSVSPGAYEGSVTTSTKPIKKVELAFSDRPSYAALGFRQMLKDLRQFLRRLDQSLPGNGGIEAVTAILLIVGYGLVRILVIRHQTKRLSPELLGYIGRQLSQGLDKGQLTKLLVEQGWKNGEVKAALRQVSRQAKR